MVINAQSLPQLMLLFIWACLCQSAVKCKFSVFVKVLSSKEIIEELLSCTSLVFAPGLLEVLQSSTPPTVAFFKSLPTDPYKVWGVYLLVLEKQNSRTKIYIGSGTNAESGVSSRLRHYDIKAYDVLPLYVNEALEEGYTIVHKGLLCSAPLPPAGVVPTTRLLFLALEAAFTFAFWLSAPRLSLSMAFRTYASGTEIRLSTRDCARTTPCMRLHLATSILHLSNWRQWQQSVLRRRPRTHGDTDTMPTTGTRSTLEKQNEDLQPRT
jgi:hypothetical protein